MGGPYWSRKDDRAWTIPKGEFDPKKEGALEAALREFKEETGKALKSHLHPLEPIQQKGGKIVYAWACEGDLDPSEFVSNTFEIEWPPRSGKVQEFPELDKIAWFTLDQARSKIIEAQMGLVVQLNALLKM